MRILRPTGEKIVLDDVERHLLFTLNVIDEIQEHYDMPIVEVISKIYDSTDLKTYAILRYVLTALLNEDVDIHNCENDGEKRKPLSMKRVGQLVTLGTRPLVTQLILAAFAEGAKAAGAESDDGADEEPEDPQMGGQ